MKTIKTYESEIKCQYCYSFVRYKANKQCVQCKKESERKRYAANREKIISRNAIWASENKEKTRVYKAEYKKRNPEATKAARKHYSENNKEKISEYRKIWNKNNPSYNYEYREKNKERIDAVCSAWRKKNSKRIVERVKKWREDNIDHARKMEAARAREWRKTTHGKAVTFIRGSIRRCLHVKGEDQRTYEAIGYHPNDLIDHIEKQFNKGMTWENYGDKWVIDHITPISEFIRSGTKDPKIINCLSNLRPFCKSENLKKSDNVEFLL